MTDKFTITREYDRDQIMADVDRIIDMDGDIYAAKRFLDMMYTGWSFDIRTACMVELKFRDEEDELYFIFADRLAELDGKPKSSCPINVDQFRL